MRYFDTTNHSDLVSEIIRISETLPQRDDNIGEFFALVDNILHA